MLDNLLVYRLVVVNAVAVVILGYCWSRGWVTTTLDGDSTHLVYAMIGLAAIFMASLAIRAGKVSGLLNLTKRGRAIALNRVKFMEKMAHLDEIPSWLVTLGLLGTVIGIMMALQGVDQDSLATAEGVRQSMSRLMDGMRVAFCTTIVGAVLGLWCDINRRILKTAAVLMLEDAKGARGAGK